MQTKITVTCFLSLILELLYYSTWSRISEHAVKYQMEVGWDFVLRVNPATSDSIQVVRALLLLADVPSVLNDIFTSPV